MQAGALFSTVSVRNASTQAFQSQLLAKIAITSLDSIISNISFISIK